MMLKLTSVLALLALASIGEAQLFKNRRGWGGPHRSWRSKHRGFGNHKFVFRDALRDFETASSGPSTLPKNTPVSKNMPRYASIGFRQRGKSNEDKVAIANLPSTGLAMSLEMPDPLGMPDPVLRKRTIGKTRGDDKPATLPSEGLDTTDDLPTPAKGSGVNRIMTLGKKSKSDSDAAASLPSFGRDVSFRMPEPMGEATAKKRFGIFGRGNLPVLGDMQVPRGVKTEFNDEDFGIIGQGNMPVLKGMQVPEGMPSTKFVDDGFGVVGQGNMPVFEGMDIPAEVAAEIEEAIEAEVIGEKEMMKQWKQRDLPEEVETLFTTPAGGPMETLMLLAKGTDYEELDENEAADFKETIERIIYNFEEQYKPEELL